ncbi:sugar phosphate isomerase/epimerase family protein [Spirosoma sp. KUDC1026]|uniref:sugar phosphate isomerase/epimerase family protein n=1 Tax=Spirosoma sp. KUDC1026 TaxID=2745947 RepID=UPI00159BC957|nr:TIM barrel protein [Spirosoma sp. KUDC1026]QKZ13981.1 sugar phosphate isomerase/epimerase [Spirosoma sp. KUDC1026]
MNPSRRQFLNQLGLVAAGLSLSPMLPTETLAEPAIKPFTFEISLAEFSFFPEIMSGKMSNLDFPARAKKDFGVNVLEYVSMFFNDKHTDPAYLKELKQRVDDLGMKNNLIMVDGANLADLDAGKRKQAVEAHRPWLDAATALGCGAIRVNLGDTSKAMSGTPDDPAEEAAKAAADGYHKLLEYATNHKLNVIVENHFGNSTDIDWLVGVLKAVNMPNAGLLPDFGNFCQQRSKPETQDIKGIMSTRCLKEYDRYEGVRKMMPYAKGISAKTHKFDAQGNETETDFRKMFKIIKDAGFTGYVGIEYEGGLMNMYSPESGYLPVAEGIKTTKTLLERVRKELA